MNKFFEGFMNEVKNKPIGGVVLNYLAQRPHFDKFIFVEGERPHPAQRCEGLLH